MTYRPCSGKQWDTTTVMEFFGKPAKACESGKSE